MTPSTTQAPARLESLPLDRLAPGENPRHSLDTESEAFIGLIESIKREGVITPILVGPPLDPYDATVGYPIIAGHRRVAAARMAGLEEIPAMIVAGEGREFILSVTENVQREDLTPIEEAEALERLRQAPFGMKQADAAQALGKSERWARERLRLLKLPGDIRLAMNERLVPLEASVHLERVAKGSERACDVIAAEVRKDPDLGRNLVDPDFVAAHLRRIASDVGLQPVADGRTYEPGSSPRKLPISKEGREELEAMLDDLPDRPYGGKPTFKFDDSDVDAARAYGCLLEIETNRHGFKQTDIYITDSEWLLDRAKAKVPAMRKEIEAEIKAQEKRSTGGAKKPAQTKEEKAEERKAEKAAGANAALAQLAMSMKPPKVDLRMAQVLAIYAVMPIEDLDDRLSKTLGQAPGGERYQWRSDDPDAMEDNPPSDVLLGEIMAAKTPAAAVAPVFRLLAAESLSLVDKTWGNRTGEVGRNWPEEELPLTIQPKELIAQIATELGIVPDTTAKAIERWRKAQEKAIKDDEALRAKIAAKKEASADE